MMPSKSFAVAVAAGALFGLAVVISAAFASAPGGPAALSPWGGAAPSFTTSGSSARTTAATSTTTSAYPPHEFVTNGTSTSNSTPGTIQSSVSGLNPASSRYSFGAAATLRTLSSGPAQLLIFMVPVAVAVFLGLLFHRRLARD